ncbi:SHIRT domain-containing protein [Gordonibacter sp. Marseille-P4307]|uniref:SHIRT domain-containing protein n=1 Tax=Gordonibacter sp. Marseille-P4307 TaxID=2161815 RepID=UPI000F540432|nr:SHIRT domain-containing protein [Gordonibacter sp. Marseille-P4307]
MGKVIMKTKKHKNVIRGFSLVLMSLMISFMSWTPIAYAENSQDKSQSENQIVTPVKEEPSSIKSNEEQGDGLEIGPEIIDQPVRQSTLPAPTIGKVFYDATTISGANVQRKRVGKDTVRSTVYVTLKDKNGNVKATASVTPKSGTSWTVNLPGGVTVAAGDTVTAYQTLDGATSDVVTANAQPSKASENKDKLKMPADEIWIEQTSSNQINNDEQAEAIEMLKNANPSIASDFKSVKFSIDGTDHAYYEVTYTDGSTSGKIEAPDLKIKTVTETSAAPTIQKVQVTDGQIIVTFDKEIAAGTKFYFVNNFTDNEDNSFCEGGKCIVDKSTSREMSQAVSVDGTKVTFPINDDDLKLGKKFGIIVKEPHKFRSCAKSEPVVTTPDKVAVRDPHKLTDADKQAIDKAIRDANTVHGVSKLPDGTGDWEGTLALIEFDKEGNARIINPSNVEGTWDWNNGGVFVPGKNQDGTYQVIDESQVTKFPAKDLVKNIAPKSPAIAVDTDKGEVTITPPAYKDPGDDTDLASYTITYKDESGAEKTVTATRTVDATTGKTAWTSDGATVDADTGVVTLQIKDLAVGDTITATAKDKGGLEGDSDPLTSNQASKKLETAKVTYDANGGTGVTNGKELNKGVKYKLSDNAFIAPENQEFDTWEVNGEKLAPGTEITVDKDTQVKAIWKDSPSYSVTYDWGADAPAGKDAPKDTGSYYKGDHYDVDATYKAGDTVEGEKDGKKGTWTFSGWTDPNNGTMGDGNATITGSWTFAEAPKYGVSYDWGADAPAGKDAPKDTGSYYKGDHYDVDATYKAGDTVEGEKDGKKGTWTFSGWTDPNNGTMGDGNATITGSWTFAEADNPKDPKNPGTVTPGSVNENTGNKRINSPAIVVPETGDAMSTSFYVCVMALIGSALSALALRLRKNSDQ